jgi:hypothetical protein
LRRDRTSPSDRVARSHGSAGVSKRHKTNYEATVRR